MKKQYHLLCALLCALMLVGFLPPLSLSTAADPPGDDRFGINWVNRPGGTASALRIGQAYQAGARWDRFPLYWPDTQPQAGVAFDWGKSDAWVDADRARGMNVQLILLAAPDWAATNGVPRDLAAPAAANPWYQFVYQSVLHYKGKVHYYELWNEPDLGQIFWKGSLADYAQLIRTGYRAVKDADPSAQVILSGLALPFDNRDWIFKFLEEMAKDPQAKANNYYFDILALHMYSRSADLYEFINGNDEWVGIRNVLKNRTGDKPIWINEVGVPIWTEDGVKGPGRATPEEAAAYVIQSYAYGLAAGVSKLFFFQLYDDGVGQTDPSGKIIERYGMFANPASPDSAGRARATYAAYQVANTYMSGAKVATRLNLNRSSQKDGKGIDIITLYGTRSGKVSVAWSNVGGSVQQVKIPASTQQAVLIDQTGKQRSLQASNGFYTIDLPAATNNNNFLCFSASGCDPNDYIIGGAPQILVESTPAVPVASIQPLSTAGDAPFWVSWKPVPGAPGAERITSYEVQWADASEGVWHSWIPVTTTSASLFGYGSPVVAKQYHTYLFRVRARDAAGNLLSDFPVQAQAGVFVTGGKAITNPPPKTYQVDERFRAYYTKFDGLRILGNPISDAFDGGGGMVQYFEKGRLEDHSAQTSDPNWRYMYGLLAGNLLDTKATLPLGGEVSTITYATMEKKQTPVPAGFRGGVVQNADGSTFIPYSATLAPAAGQIVPALFWSYINDPKLFPGGWLHDIGLPVSPAIPAIVNKAGIGERWIMIQAFQRTVLTYDPRNPAGWQVERANIGTDYKKANPANVPK